MAENAVYYNTSSDGDCDMDELREFFCAPTPAQAVQNPGFLPALDFRSNIYEPIAECSRCAAYGASSSQDVRIPRQCQWANCMMTFSQSIEYYSHVKTKHATQSMDLRCHWRDCSRPEPFFSKSVLAAHLRKHTGEKPFVCESAGCGKAYSRAADLRNHFRMHTGEKPYSCGFPGCSKAFSTKSDCKKHESRTHEMQKNYKCNIGCCSKEYGDPSSLRKHTKKFHGEECWEDRKRNNALKRKSVKHTGLVAAATYPRFTERNHEYRLDYVVAEDQVDPTLPPTRHFRRTSAEACAIFLATF